MILHFEFSKETTKQELEFPSKFSDIVGTTSYKANHNVTENKLSKQHY